MAALTAPALGADVTPLVGVDWLKTPSARSGSGRARHPLRHRRRRRARPTRPRISPAACTATTTKPAGASRAATCRSWCRPRAELEKLIGDLGIDEDTPCRRGAGGRQRARFRLRRAHLLDAEICRRRQGLDPRRRRRRLEAGRPAGRDRRARRRRRRFSPPRSTRACWPRPAKSRRSRRKAARR